MSENDATGPGGFADDLRASASVLRANPWLPVLAFLIFAGPSIVGAVALTVVGYDPDCYAELRRDPACVGTREAAASGLASLISLPLAVFSVGWVGSERIWFLRAYRGTRLSPGEAFGFIWPFWGRYFRLGLIMMIGFAPILIAGFATGNTSLLFWLLVAFFAVFDFLLTFVTPALAYSTNSVVDAWSIGWFMLKDHWPRSAPYVLVPPLVLLVLGRALPSAFIGLWATTALTCAGTLGNLWFKGAVARFYLRIYPGVPEDGSAGLRRSNQTPHIPAPGENWPW